MQGYAGLQRLLGNPVDRGFRRRGFAGLAHSQPVNCNGLTHSKTLQKLQRLFIHLGRALWLDFLRY